VLAEAIEGATAADAVRVIIVTGAGAALAPACDRVVAFAERRKPVFRGR
jgi:hypothetical protein